MDLAVLFCVFLTALPAVVTATTTLKLRGELTLTCSEQAERVARHNCMPQLRASSFRARQNSQLHANCKPRLRPAASRNCNQQLPAATAAIHPPLYEIMA